MKDYSIHHVPGEHLKFKDRLILARDWNRQVNNGPRPTIRGFARDHGLAPATWHREYERGKVGASVPDQRDGRRREYNEYDPFKAQDAVNEGHGNKGAAMRVTNKLAAMFEELVLMQKLSPYDAVCRIRKALPGAYVPCVRTWYNHIAHGDLAVKYGQTPYHPDRDRPKHPRPHPARTMPGRLGIADRPREADERLEPGHYEIDTVVSCIGGRGGLLVLIDRMTRRYCIALIGRISQRAVNRALARMVKDGTLGKVKSVTADNGSEFLDPAAIRRILGCDVYYTRAYASWEKGSVERSSALSTPSAGGSSEAGPPTSTPPHSTPHNPRKKDCQYAGLQRRARSPSGPIQKIVSFPLHFTIYENGGLTR